MRLTTEVQIRDALLDLIEAKATLSPSNAAILTRKIDHCAHALNAGRLERAGLDAEDALATLAGMRVRAVAVARTAGLFA